jgi:hypothetical protein
VVTDISNERAVKNGTSRSWFHVEKDAVAKGKNCLMFYEMCPRIFADTLEMKSEGSVI